MEYLKAHLSDFGGVGWDMATKAAQVGAVTRWPATSTVFLSSDPATQIAAGQTAADEREWQSDQRALATLAHGMFRVVPGAGDDIFRDNPSTAAAAIATVLADGR